MRVPAWDEYVTVTLQETLGILLVLAAHIWEQVPQSVDPQYPCCRLEMFEFQPLTSYSNLSGGTQDPSLGMIPNQDYPPHSTLRGDVSTGLALKLSRAEEGERP